MDCATRRLLFFLHCLLCSPLLLGQSTPFVPNQDAVAYINKYKQLAMQEMGRSGIPASITLAQGLLESGFGKSELSRKSHNHFGIKCKTEWTGERVYHDDNAKGECFRKYSSPENSYIDHSNFLLRNDRYKKLFSYKITDYKSWAHGLKKAGYATNPKYAKILIRYIENYQLDQYTPAFWAQYQKENQRKGSLLAKNKEAGKQVPVKTTILDTAKSEQQIVAKLVDVEEFIRLAHGEGEPILLTQTSEVSENNKKTTPQVVLKIYDHFVVGKKTTVNKVPAICLPKGFSLFELAQKYKIPLASIYRYNDLTFQEYKNDILQRTMLVYLAPKRSKGDIDIHKMRQGESLHDISQLYGIKLKKLLRFNRLKLGDTPIEGAAIYLQQYAPNKPNTT